MIAETLLVRIDFSFLALSPCIRTAVGTLVLRDWQTGEKWVGQAAWIIFEPFGAGS